jgi:hypothetical protein
VEEKNTTTNKKDPDKKNSNTPTHITKTKTNVLLYIIISVFAFLIIGTLLIFFVFKDVFNTGVDLNKDLQEDFQQEIEKAEESTEPVFEAETEEKLEGELESRDLLGDDWQEDVPLSGGIVTSLKKTNTYYEIQLAVASDFDEVFDWYVDALTKAGWYITEQEKVPNTVYDDTQIGNISFSLENEITGTLRVEKASLYPTTHVTIIRFQNQ